MSEIHSALQYLHSQIDWEKASDEGVMVLLQKNSILLSEENVAGTIYEPGNNPLFNLLECVSMEMCADCLQIPYLYKDPFFVSLAKAYVEFLAIKYGPEVSISKEMTKAFILNDLTTYQIVCVTLETEIILNKSNVETYQSDSCIYKMLVNV